MPRALRLDIPLDWVRPNSPNRRPGNRWQSARQRAELREWTHLLTLEQGEARGAWPLASPRVFVVAMGPRLWDRDNLVAALKGAIDGIVDAGALVDDRDLRWPHVVTVPRAPSVEPHPRVRLTILGAAS